MAAAATKKAPKKKAAKKKAAPKKKAAKATKPTQKQQLADAAAEQAKIDEALTGRNRAQFLTEELEAELSIPDIDDALNKWEKAKRARTKAKDTEAAAHAQLVELFHEYKVDGEYVSSVYGERAAFSLQPGHERIGKKIIQKDAAPAES